MVQLIHNPKLFGDGVWKVLFHESDGSEFTMGFFIPYVIVDPRHVEHACLAKVHTGNIPSFGTRDEKAVGSQCFPNVILECVVIFFFKSIQSCCVIGTKLSDF